MKNPTSITYYTERFCEALYVGAQRSNPDVIPVQDSDLDWDQTRSLEQFRAVYERGGDVAKRVLTPYGAFWVWSSWCDPDNTDAEPLRVVVTGATGGQGVLWYQEPVWQAEEYGRSW